MTHFSRISNVVIDLPADDHEAEVAFWQGALGIALEPNRRFPEFHGGELAGGVGLLLQRLGDGPARVHVDIHTTDRAAEVARLRALGATLVEEGELWTVMRDPAGLVFCVVPDRRLDATNAHVWP